ncbi:hypothetical protein ACFX11_046631 [Malus domestica]
MRRNDVKAIVLTGSGGRFSTNCDVNVFKKVHEFEDVLVMPDVSADFEVRKACCCCRQRTCTKRRRCQGSALFPWLPLQLPLVLDMLRRTQLFPNHREDSPTGSVAPSKPFLAQSISSSVHVYQSSQGQRCPDEGDDGYGRGSNGGSKFDTGSKNQQTARSATVSSHNTPSGTLSAHGESSVKGNGSDIGSGLSAEAYSRRHEISVVGDNMPPPFTSFESTGFPSEILRDVQHLLLGGANVVTAKVVFAELWSSKERDRLLPFQQCQHSITIVANLQIQRCTCMIAQGQKERKVKRKKKKLLQKQKKR